MNNLIASANRKIIILLLSVFAGKNMGDNPHIWYDPKTMLAYADNLAAQLGQLDEPINPIS